MADMFGFYNKGIYENSGKKSVGGNDDDADFDEEDVWAVTNETIDPNPNLRKSKDSSISSSTPTQTHKRLPTVSRKIPRASNNNSSCVHEAKVVQLSAPVNIPDWSKIYKKNSNKGSNSHGFGGVNVNDQDHGHLDGSGVIENDEHDDDDDDDMVPPHEWISKKLARSQISSFSVCEGVGRTLKGRDLSNVRNAVLTRTGFLE